MTRRRGGKHFGTPVGEPRPQGIDSWSGFKVDLEDFKKQWDGNLTVRPDVRNPQDFVRGIKDDQSLPYSRPESPNVFIAQAICWESGAIMTTEQGAAILTEGVVAADTL